MADITSAISLEELNKRFAQIGYDEEAMQKQLDAEIAKSKVKFVVLDDDPTGVQTVGSYRFSRMTSCTPATSLIFSICPYWTFAEMILAANVKFQPATVVFIATALVTSFLSVQVLLIG